MTVPTIESISPNEGFAEGRTLVEITGTGFALPPDPPPEGPTDGILPETVEVIFGDRRARRIRVRDDPARPPDGTVLVCLTPPYGGDPKDLSPVALVDVTLRNLDPVTGAPIPGEEATLVGGYGYRRPSIVEESDLARLVRTVLRDLKRQVMENVSLTVSTEYDEDASDGLNIAMVSKLPALILVGPELAESRPYSTNVPAEEAVGEDIFHRRLPPKTVDIEFTLVGVSDHSVQLLNLMNACSRFFARNTRIEMPRDPADPSKGSVRWDMDMVEPFKVTSRPSESNVRSFSGTFAIRGFDVDEGIVSEKGHVVGEQGVEIQGQALGAND
jgi:hypothetical protein